MKREPIAVVLVGPSALLREGLARILSAAHFRVLASVSSVDDPILSSLPQDQSILLVIDASDDFDSSLGQIVSFKKRYAAGRVAVLTHQQQLTEIVSAYRAGAHAYLVKVANSDTFIKSLELVMLGMTLFPPEIFSFISGWQDRCRNRHAADDKDDAGDGRADDDDNVDNDDDSEMVAADPGTNEQVATGYTPRLSARQQSILGCLIQGDSNKTIARKMAITEATVKVHVKTILRKIRVHNRTQAAIWAMNTGPFITPTDEVSLALEKLPVEPLPSLDIAQALSARPEKGSTLLPTPKLKGANHVALPNIVHLVRKAIHRKSD